MSFKCFVWLKSFMWLKCFMWLNILELDYMEYDNVQLVLGIKIKFLCAENEI